MRVGSNILYKLGMAVRLSPSKKPNMAFNKDSVRPPQNGKVNILITRFEDLDERRPEHVVQE